MGVVVEPETFTYVQFDASEITAITERLVGELGMPADAEVQVVVDEKVPLGRATLTSIDPIRLQIDGGAFEDPKRPRQLAPADTADVVGRLLAQARDRLDESFGDVPANDDLTLPHAVAWDVYGAARLARAGYRAQRQRRLYAFRLQHGFSDAADASFDELWTRDGLTWADIVQLSDRAAAERVAADA